MSSSNNNNSNTTKKADYNNNNNGILDKLSTAFHSQATLTDNKSACSSNNRQSATPPSPLRKRSSGNTSSSYYYRSSPDVDRRRDSNGINYSNLVSAFNEYQQQKSELNSIETEPSLVTFRKREPSPSPPVTASAMNNDKPTTITTNTTHRGRIAKRLSPAATITTLNQNPHITANSTLLAAKEAKSISPVELARRLQTNIPEPLLIDTRPLEVYEESRLRNSIHITVPTLLIKRYRRGVVSNFNLESFITTSEGMDRFRSWLKRFEKDEQQPKEVVIYDDQMTDKTSATWTLISVLQKNAMQVHWLQGGFDGFLAWDKERLHVIGSEFRRSDTPPLPIPTSMNEDSFLRSPHPREQPNKLKIPMPMVSRSATTLSSHHGQHPVHVQRRASLFNLDTKNMRPHTKNRPQPIDTHTTHPKDLFSINENEPKTASASASASLSSSSQTPTVSISSANDEEDETFYTPLEHPLPPPPLPLHHQREKEEENPPLLMAVRGLNENGSSTVTPKTENEYDFVISEIIPHFLYLGPEIATSEQLNDLRDRSIRRILNMAEECDDDVPGLKENFIYRKIAAQDIVEMQNIQGTLKKAVCVIEDSKKHHEPIYVHCKAGKSRSAAAILAYLVLSEHWTLKRAYRHIVKARPNISPNIGFVAELMKLEEGVHGEVSDFAGIDWRLIDLANPPSPETQKEMGRIEKAWKRGKSMSDDLATVVKNQENDA